MKSFSEMTIALASDHAGFPLKQQVQLFLEDNGAKVKDFGCFNTESCDYRAPAGGRCGKGRVRVRNRYLLDGQRYMHECEQAPGYSCGIVLGHQVGRTGPSAQQCERTRFAGEFHFRGKGFGYRSHLLPDGFRRRTS